MPEPISIGSCLLILRTAAMIGAELIEIWKEKGELPTEIELDEQKLTYVTDVLDKLRAEREGGS